VFDDSELKVLYRFVDCPHSDQGIRMIENVVAHLVQRKNSRDDGERG